MDRKGEKKKERENEEVPNMLFYNKPGLQDYLAVAR